MHGHSHYLGVFSGNVGLQLCSDELGEPVIGEASEDFVGGSSGETDDPGWGRLGEKLEKCLRD